jgi:hypothetical protein
MNASGLFAEARHVELLRRLRLIRPADRAELRKRVTIVVLLGWLPLVIAVSLQGRARGAFGDEGFFTDIAVHARLLVAVPLLVVAEYIVLPRLGAMAEHFSQSGLVPPSGQDAYVAIVARSRALSAGTWPSMALLAVAYAATAVLARAIPPELMPAWQRAGSSGWSLAGWWHMLVSLPILLGLVLGWAWRLVVWAHFLHRMAGLGLNLVASHPDRAAGLQFVAFSPRVFAPVATALATIVAGTMANRMVHLGQSPVGHELTPMVTVLVIVALCASPPLAFARSLMVTWRAGVFLYGTLARRIGATFEDKWFARADATDASALEVPDFSATVDLYGVVANVYAMRLVLFDAQGLAALVFFVVLPFLPVWLAAVPMTTLAHHLADMLF